MAAGCITLLAASSTWGNGPGAIRWEPDFETAMQKGGQQNRLVLIHFWNDGCPPCESVERNVFPDPQVAQAINTHYVAVKVHAGRRADLAQKFGIHAWPTDIVLTPNGFKVGQSISPQHPGQYMQMVQQIAARERNRSVNPTGGIAQIPPQQAPGVDDRNSSFPTSSNRAGQVSYQAADGGEFPLNSNRGAPAGNPSVDMTAAYNPGGNALQQPYPAQQAQTQPPYANSYAANGSVYPPGLSNPPGGMNPAVAARGPGQATSPPWAPSPSQSATFQRSPLGGAVAQNPGAPPQGVAPPQFNNTQNRFANSAPSSPLLANATPSASNSPPTGAVPPNVAPPAAQAAPPTSPNLALDGCCVVSLVEQLHLPVEQQRWRKGDARYGAIHRGQTYLFAGPGEQQRFLANPDYYTPVLSGHDPVAYLEAGQLVSGRREHGFTHDGKIYLFASESNMQTFWASRDMFVGRIQQAMNASANQPAHR
jgi:YHS domain-containing protein/thiol-disulfide isomerase/thioredoxin